ncbi:MAG: ROK family protein [Sarcina sp.]
MYLGVDIGGTEVKIGIVTNEGKILAKDSYKVSFDNYKTPIFETVKQSIEMFLLSNNIKISTLKGIGVSATGQVDCKTGTILGTGGNIKNWCGTQIKKELEEIYNIKVTVMNDANCMIIGELWTGQAKNFKHVIGITIGTGIGAGIIINSNILVGAQGIAGEIGHFSIADDKKCGCGNVGCYELYGSTTALVKKVKENYEKLGEVSFSELDINGKVIFDELSLGNSELEKIVDEWISYIGKGLVSLVHIFNPELILIGGGVSKQENLFIAKVRKFVMENSMIEFSRNLKIESAILGNDAGIIGAIHYNINN